MSDNMQDGSIDVYTPTQMAYRVETVGVAKARMGLVPMVGLGIMAGAFISFGAMNFTMAMAQGLPRIVASVLFCLGLIMVIVGGAELFTGNNLIAMAWAQGKVKTRAVLRNWFWIYAANLVGCLASVILAHLSGILNAVDLGFGVQALKIAVAKTSLPFGEAFFKGILCNSLVCLAVWLCFAARTVADRVLCIIFPISAFVNMGFEHSIANLFFIPMGFLAAADPAIVAASGLSPEVLAQLNWSGFFNNIAAVTLGNTVGGTVLVAGMYYIIYLRGQRRPREQSLMEAILGAKRKS